MLLLLGFADEEVSTVRSHISIQGTVLSPPEKSNKDIYYEEALQHLGGLVCPYLDPAGHENWIADQFLNGIDNQELRVQARALKVYYT